MCLKADTEMDLNAIYLSIHLLSICQRNFFGGIVLHDYNQVIQLWGLAGISLGSEVHTEVGKLRQELICQP